MKNDIENGSLDICVNELKPHSNCESLSLFGLWGAKIKFTNNNIKANIGIKMRKKVILLIYIFSINRDSIFTIFKLSAGTNINIRINNVSMDIIVVNPLDSLI